MSRRSRGGSTGSTVPERPTTTDEPRPPSRLRAVGVLAAVDLTRLVGDRLALFFIVILPVVIIIVIGATSGASTSQAPLGIVDLDGGDASARLVESFRASGLVTVETYEREADMATDIRLGGIAGGVTIPEGFGDALAAGDAGTVDLLTDQKQGTGLALSTIVSTVVAREGQVVAAARFAAAETGLDRNDLLARAAAEQVRIRPVPVEVESTGRASLSSTNRYAYTAPSNLVLFVFINSLTGAAALVESRKLGVTRRVLAAPVGVGTIVAGAGLTRFIVALVQSVLILGVGALVFGVEWGDPLAAAVLVLAFAVLATGAGLLVGALANKPEQVPAIGIPVAMGLAMLGGCMWPLEVVPASLQTVGHLTPHAWAMDAWISLSFEGGDLGTISGSLAVLAAWSVVVLGLAVWRLRRTLVS